MQNILKRFFIIMGLASLLAVVGCGRAQNNGDINQTPTSIQKFSCSGLEGFVFNYPVFKGWEPLFSTNLKAYNSECDILLSYADSQAHGISADPPPQIRITKEYYQGVPGEMSAPANFSENTKNSQGVLYTQKDNYVGFWVGDAVVKIQLVGVAPGYNFSEKLFWQEVIKTFSIKK